MWGADTPLVIDALQIAALAAVVGAGAVFAILRLRRNPQPETEPRPKAGLEERVQVLERIATDRSQDLADEIEALRSDSRKEGADQ